MKISKIVEDVIAERIRRGGYEELNTAKDIKAKYPQFENVDNKTLEDILEGLKSKYLDSDDFSTGSGCDLQVQTGHEEEADWLFVQVKEKTASPKFIVTIDGTDFSYEYHQINHS